MKQTVWSMILFSTCIIPFSLVIILHPVEHIAMLLLLTSAGIMAIASVFLIYADDTISIGYRKENEV